MPRKKGSRNRKDAERTPYTDLILYTEDDLPEDTKKALTAATGYLPTPAEQRLLLVMADPVNIGASVTEVCQKAQISRQTYYQTMQKPEFAKYAREFSLRALHSHTAPLIQSLIQNALGGSPLHTKMALEMLGLHVDRRQVDANVTSRQVVITFAGKGAQSGEIIDVTPSDDGH